MANISTPCPPATRYQPSIWRTQVIRGPLIVRTSIAAGICSIAIMIVLGTSCSPSLRSIDAKEMRAVDRHGVRVAEEALPAIVSITCERKPSAEKSVQEELYEYFRESPFTPFDDREPKETPVPPRKMPAETVRRSVGSGWIYDSSGYIVTNAHVVRDAVRISVRLNDVPADDREYPAQLWGIDPRSELAVLKIKADRKLPHLKLGRSSHTQVGSWVMAVGSPFALQQSVTVGVVSAKGRLLPGQDASITIGDVIQTDASINVGNSGGPLIDRNAEVIGINVAIASAGASPMPANVGIGFAIPADTASHVIPKLISDRRVARGWLGVGIDDLTYNLRDFYNAPQGGALVTHIFDDTPAATAGLKVDDVITEIAGVPVTGAWGVQKNISRHEPGSKAILTVIRDGEKQKIPAILGAVPERYTGLLNVDLTPEMDLISGPGIEVAEATPRMRAELGFPDDTGVIVTKIAPNSTAVGRVLKGDGIARVDHQAVATIADYDTALNAAILSERGYVVLHLRRMTVDGQVKNVVIDLPALPAK